MAKAISKSCTLDCSCYWKLVRTIESWVKWMLDSERTFKIKVSLRWTVFEISFTSAIICII